MKRYVLAMLAGLTLAASPLAAQQIDLDTQAQAEEDALNNLSWDTDNYQNVRTFNLGLRNYGPSPEPLAGGIPVNSNFLIGANNFYGQLQSGVFGENAVNDQWSAFGSPGSTITGVYGLRYNWASDFATFSLNNVTATRKDATIGFGSGSDSLLNINFINASFVATTIASFLPAPGLRLKGAARVGIETSNSELPIVNVGTGPSPLGTNTKGYIGLVNRRINDSFAGVANNGRVLARTDVLTLMRDGTNGGMRIGYLLSDGNLGNVACSGITAAGGVVAKAFIPVVEPLPGPAVVTANTIFTDAQKLVAIHCSFGNAIRAGNVTIVDIQRFPGDDLWVGTLSSTFNQ